MARIAVDARPLSMAITGIGRYTQAILKRLVNSEHEWYLYSDKPLLADFEGRPNVTVRHGHFSLGGVSSVFAQVIFPYWARRDEVDAFWSPRHHLPLFLGQSVSKVLTVHDLVWKHSPETMSKLGLLLERVLMPPSLRIADAVVAVSHTTNREINESFSISPDKVKTIYEAPFYDPVEGEKCLGDYFLFVGTIEPRKNLIRLIDAYSIYSSKVPSPLRLKICGGRGWGGVELQAKLRERGICELVDLLGYVSDAELKDLYRNSRALVIPSVYEGFGLPIVEAFSQGAPVLTSSCGAMAEIAGDAALLVDPNNTQELARGLEVLGCDLDAVISLQRLSRERAKIFSWETAAEETLTLIESSLYQSGDVY